MNERRGYACYAQRNCPSEDNDKSVCDDTIRVFRFLPQAVPLTEREALCMRRDQPPRAREFQQKRTVLATYTS
jgi:hypothetical protein